MSFQISLDDNSVLQNLQNLYFAVGLEAFEDDSKGIQNN